MAKAATKAEKPYKITSLTIENFKRVVAAHIAPDGNIINIYGANGAGKSSVLDAIWTALGGKAVAPAVPVRKGAKESKIVVDLGDILVSWKQTADTIDADEKPIPGKKYLEVISKEGAKFAKPQEVLDSLIGKLCFDPLAFMRLKPAEQAAMIAKIAGIDVQGYEARRKMLYDARTDANRRAKEAESAYQAEVRATDEACNAAGIATPPKERTSIDDAIEKLNEANAHNRDVVESRAALKSMKDGHQMVIGKHKDAEAAVEKVKAENDRRLAEAVEAMNRAAIQVKTSADKLKEHEAKIEKKKEVPTHDFESAISNAEPINTAFAAAERAEEAKGRASQLKAAALKADGEVKACDDRHQAAIEAAKLPVKGITFNSTGVQYNGVPFEQSAASEQLRISAEIAAAENPKLHVMAIRDASLLDLEGRKLLAKMADERDFQVFMETVDNGQQIGVHIVDGRVV